MDNQNVKENYDLTVREMPLDDDERIIANLTTARTSFCSMNAVTPEEKAQLFNAMNSPDARIADLVNVSLDIVDVYAEVVECINQDTGEISKCPRVVLIDKDGKSYQAVSKGIFNAVSKLIAVYGLPHWETPVTVTPYQITKGSGNNTRKILSLKIGGKTAKVR